MYEERVLIYVQGDNPEEELLRMKDALNLWAVQNKMNILLAITEGVESGVRIWERNSIAHILNMVKFGLITTILVLDENMVSRNIEERYLFYHFVQRFGGNVRTKERYVDNVADICSFLDRMNQMVGPLWMLSKNA